MSDVDQPKHSGRRASSRLLIVPLLVTTGLTACETPAERASRMEDALAAAGFIARPADTPRRQAMLASMPRNRLLRQARGDTVAYVYADPLVCNCLYIGNQEAYARYQRQAQRERLANERENTAEILADSTWDPGPWGPFPGGFGW